MANRFGSAFVLVCSIVLQCGVTAIAQPRFAFDATPGVLPKDVVPSHYALVFDLDPAREEFSGKASIAIRVREPVAFIAIHAHELKASGVTLSGAGGSHTLSVIADAKTQTWRLVRDDAARIDAGDYTLDIGYTGVVHGSGEGLYRADYSVLGKAARMLATQLEARFARTLFPSFDEPVFRAVFDIAVRTPKEYDVVSNMPVSSKVSEGNTEMHRFQPTPPMPSYLVTVAVGRFDVLTGEAAGVPLRILSAEGKREQSQYAMDVTKQVLPFYTAYFGLPYALPKLDQLAVPSTRWGAMEDWGMISYAEPFVLFDPTKSGPDTQRDVFAVIAHEVSHQWFGNLVTASSWEEIWLNEAFATWVERKTTAKFNPSWQVDLRQRLPIDRAMTRDASSATRAIRSGPVNESSVFDVFDDITYTKGGAVLSMLELWIGPEVFRRGLTAYLESQKYSNATAGDLWYHLSRASGQDVSEVAATWTDQQGFPVVQVSAACNQGRTLVTLAQSRFTAIGANSTARIWKIPVRLSRGSDVTSLLFDSAQASFELGGCVDEPLLANAGGAGFYRVKYEPAHLRMLASRFLRLAPSDRVTLLSDTFALAQAGRVPMASYFTLLAGVPQVNGADRATLFSMASDELTFLDQAMAGTPAQRKVRAAGRLLFVRELSRLGWIPGAEEDSETLKLRGLLISQLARFDDRSTIERARQLFDLDESGKATLLSSIRSAVVEAVGTHADRMQFSQLLRRLKSADSEEDRWIFAHALAAGRNAGRAREFLATSLTGVAAPNIASEIPAMVADGLPLLKWPIAFRLPTGSSWATSRGPSESNGYCRVSRRTSTTRNALSGCSLISAARPAKMAHRLRPAPRLASNSCRPSNGVMQQSSRRT